MKVTLQMHARQPDIQLIKHHSVMQPYGTKQLRLGILKEVNVSTVKDNARRIDITPAHALFDGKFLVIRHYDCDKNSSNASLNCCVRSRLETCPAWSNTTRREVSIA